MFEISGCRALAGEEVLPREPPLGMFYYTPFQSSLSSSLSTKKSHQRQANSSSLIVTSSPIAAPLSPVLQQCSTDSPAYREYGPFVDECLERQHELL